MRKWLYAIVVLVVALLAAGCGSSGGQNGAAARAEGSSKSYPELRWALNNTGEQLEYRKLPSNNSATMEHLVVQSLVEFEPDGKVGLGLARSVEHPSPTTYIYHLKSGVRFSDGKPLTVADVVYSLDLNNAKESATKAYWEDVSSVSSRGNSTVIVQLKRPNALWPEFMAQVGEVVEKAAAERVGEKAQGTSQGLPIGTGPWKFDSFTPEADVTYSRNSYWSGPPQPAKRITITTHSTEASMALALRSGAVDGTYVFFDPRPFENIPGARLLKGPSAEVEFLAMNTQAAPFNDVHVRRAVAYATNVSGMVKALIPPGNAEEASTLAPAAAFTDVGPASEVSATLKAIPKYSFDLEAAKRELAKSSYPHGFTTTVQVFGGQQVPLGACEIVAADLAKIGITVKIHEFKSAEFTTIFEGKYAMMVEGVPGFYPDPDAQFSLLLPSSQIDPPGSGYNMARFKNAEVDKLLPEERETTNPAQRLQIFGKVAKIVASEVPYRPMYSLDAIAGLSDKYAFPAFSQWSILFTPWAMDVKLAS
jgi:peptide/nickel transport system substrate-binding protein